MESLSGSGITVPSMLSMSVYSLFLIIIASSLDGRTGTFIQTAAKHKAASSALVLSLCNPLLFKRHFKNSTFQVKNVSKLIESGSFIHGKIYDMKSSTNTKTRINMNKCKHYKNDISKLSNSESKYTRRV